MARFFGAVPSMASVVVAMVLASASAWAGDPDAVGKSALQGAGPLQRDPSVQSGFLQGSGPLFERTVPRADSGGVPWIAPPMTLAVFQASPS